MEFGAPLVYGRTHGGSDAQTPLYERILDLAIRADAAGFGRIWLQEHHMIYMLQSPSALISAVQIAQHVSARVGTAVVVLPYHQPIQLAGEIAQADNATGGRLDLGVGRGAYGYEFAKFGIPFEESRTRFIEILEAIRALWLNEDTESSFHGAYVDFDDVYIWPRPVQRPHPPIWIAAQTPAAVEDAAMRGYNVLTQLFIWPDEHLVDLVAAFRRGQEQGGVSGTRLAATRYTYLAENAADRDARIDDLIDNWRIHQQLHDFSHTANPLGVIKPVVQQDEPSRDDLCSRLLIGTEEHVRAKVEKYRDLGLDVLNMGTNFGLPQDRIVDSMTALGSIITDYSTATEAA